MRSKGKIISEIKCYYTSQRGMWTATILKSEKNINYQRLFFWGGGGYFLFLYLLGWFKSELKNNYHYIFTGHLLFFAFSRELRKVIWSEIMKTLASFLSADSILRCWEDMEFYFLLSLINSLKHSKIIQLELINAFSFLKILAIKKTWFFLLKTRYTNIKF